MSSAIMPSSRPTRLSSATRAREKNAMDRIRKLSLVAAVLTLSAMSASTAFASPKILNVSDPQHASVEPPAPGQFDGFNGIDFFFPTLHETFSCDGVLSAEIQINDQRTDEFRASALSLFENGEEETCFGEHVTVLGAPWKLELGVNGKGSLVGDVMLAFTCGTYSSEHVKATDTLNGPLEITLSGTFKTTSRACPKKLVMTTTEMPGDDKPGNLSDQVE
jgi:hypothetical protein